MNRRSLLGLATACVAAPAKLFGKPEDKWYLVFNRWTDEPAEYIESLTFRDNTVTSTCTYRNEDLANPLFPSRPITLTSEQAKNILEMYRNAFPSDGWRFVVTDDRMFFLSHPDSTFPDLSRHECYLQAYRVGSKEQLAMQQF